MDAKGCILETSFKNFMHPTRQDKDTEAIFTTYMFGNKSCFGAHKSTTYNHSALIMMLMLHVLCC